MTFLAGNAGAAADNGGYLVVCLIIDLFIIISLVIMYLYLKWKCPFAKQIH